MIGQVFLVVVVVVGRRTGWVNELVLARINHGCDGAHCMLMLRQGVPPGAEKGQKVVVVLQ